MLHFHEFIAFLVFMHLSLPTNLSNSIACFGACLALMAWMSPHSLHLISSLA